MQWILVVIISLCWCEGDAIRCRNSIECRRNMMKDWNDRSYKPYVLQEEERDYLLRGTDREQPKPTHPGTRQECRTLSDAQRNRLFRAFQWLFTTKPRKDMGEHSRYQIFASQHNQQSAPGAHLGPCFPGWHREYLLRFERALQKNNSAVNLCYWDSSLDSSLPDASHSVLWSAEYFGNGQGNVTTGFAANLTTGPVDCPSIQSKLFREVVLGRNSLLFNQDKTDAIFGSAYNFTQLVWPYSGNMFEMFHGSVHGFVGGQMSNINCAVIDPVFWFHHTYIDYLWEKCRERQRSNKETDYPNDTAVPANHKATDSMKPFLKTCQEGLSESYTKDYYNYRPSPSACTSQASCGGKALWCNNGRCTACVGPGGRMGANWPNAACLIKDCTTPQNVNSVCTCVP